MHLHVHVHLSIGKLCYCRLVDIKLVKYISHYFTTCTCTCLYDSCLCYAHDGKVIVTIIILTLKSTLSINGKFGIYIHCIVATCI